MRRTLISATVGLLGVAAAYGTAAAQSGNGFLLGTPHGSLAIRGGYDRALANSNLFDDTRQFLTLGKSDFSGGTVAADVALRANERFDLVLGSGYSASDARSEYVDFVDDRDQPIEQRTRFRRVPISLSVKAYLAPRGRSVGEFAWVPAKLAPYVGVGGGALWYRFEQRGDFIDFDTSNQRVFSSTLRTSQWTGSGHGFVGTDYTLTPALSLTGEARYTFARTTADAFAFRGYHVDLSGVAMTAGLAVRF